MKKQRYCSKLDAITPVVLQKYISTLLTHLFSSFTTLLEKTNYLMIMYY